MSVIHDQYHGDPTLTRLLAALDDRPRALEAIKHASFDAETAESLPSSAFAWDGERRFPIHTREDTIASIAYRSKYAGAVPAFVDERLDDAAEAYGIDPDLFTPATPQTKVAAAPVEYALPDEERLPLGDGLQVKVAAEVLMRDGHTLPLADRVLAFAKVAAAAAAHGERVHPDVGAYAALNACNTQMLRDRIGARAATTKVAMMKTAFDQLDLALMDLPPVIYDKGVLLKLAARLEDLDERAEITEHYGRKIFDPMKTVFNGGEKIAAFGSEAEQMRALPPEIWEQVDAPEMAALRDNPEEFAKVYDTLPLDIKTVLRRQMG